MIIKRNKIKEDKRKKEECYQGRMFGEMKRWREGERLEKVLKKKNEYNLTSTIFSYLNLSKILHFLFFKTKRERKYK